MSEPIRSDQELTLETSVFQIFHSGNSTFINSFDKTTFSCFTPPPAQHHSFLRNDKIVHLFLFFRLAWVAVELVLHNCCSLPVDVFVELFPRYAHPISDFLANRLKITSDLNRLIKPNLFYSFSLPTTRSSFCTDIKESYIRRTTKTSLENPTF